MIIREVELFAGMSDEVVDEVTKMMVSLTKQAGESLFEQGDPADDLYILESGRLELKMPGAAKPTIVARSPGEAVGWSSLAGREKYSAGVTCAEDCRLLKLNKADLDVILRRYPLYGMLFYKRLAGVVGERLIMCHQALVQVKGD